MFDLNTAIGHWPFRPLPDTTLAGLRARLERHGISGAAVAHTHALFYKDCHAANRELAAELAADDGFFAGVATLNPLYAAWERDLRECREKLGLRALRLAPQYHGYRLSSPEARAIRDEATELGLPLLIPHRVVDIRQCHRLDVQETVAAAEAGEFAAGNPRARVVLTEISTTAEALCDERGRPRFPNLYLETSRLASAYGQGLARLAGALGADKLLFGSGSPFKEVEPALLKLHHADLPEAERELIAAGNARLLLDLRESI